LDDWLADLVAGLDTGGRKSDNQEQQLKASRMRKEALDMSVSRNDAVQTNESAPARPRAVFVNDFSCKSFVLAIIPVRVGA